MIRVVYRWRVEPHRQDAFRPWWHQGTISIRSTQQGALGSTLCRSTEDPDILVGIARWKSRQDVERFWASAGPVTFEGALMESIEVLDELDDLTSEDGPGS
jgi:heme-degrading monooxygenase HmoA